MPPSRSRGGDPAATERTASCGSGRSLSTTPYAPRRRGDPKPTSTVGAVNTSLLKYAVLVLEVRVEGPPTPGGGFEEAYGWPTPVQRSMPIGAMPCAQTGSSRTAAFCFLPMANGLVGMEAEGGRGGGRARGDLDPYGQAVTPSFCLLPPGGGMRARTAALFVPVVNGFAETAAASGAGGGGSWASGDMHPYDHHTSPSILVLAPSRELAEKGCLSETVESLRLSNEAIKYLVMNEADADGIFDELKIRKIAGGIGMPRKPLRQAFSFVATLPPEIQESNSLVYWLYLKALPTTAIHGDRNEERLVVERSRVSVKEIQYQVKDEADCILDMRCEIQRNYSPHRGISSSRSSANFWFFMLVLFSLLTRAVSVDTNFNITTTMDDFQGYCPAPPFQSKFIKSPILAPIPTPKLNIVHPSCLSLITVLGSILSVLSNCGLMLLINTVETVNNSRRKWVGFSSVFFTAAYQLWILHLYQNEPSDICKFICSLMLLVLHLSYTFLFWNMRWKVQIIVIGSIFVCLLGGISGFSDGIFAIIFMFAGHVCRLWSARNDLNWPSFACAIIGLIGSVLQSIATDLSFHDMPLYQMGSLVVLAVRAFEVLVHIKYIDFNKTLGQDLSSRMRSGPSNSAEEEGMLMNSTTSHTNAPIDCP